MVTGTHGNERGQSGLTVERLLYNHFYTEDCRMVGVEAGPNRARGLPLTHWDNLPLISQRAQKIDPPPSASFYDDEELRGMDVRLANMSYYHGHQQKLEEDIKEVNTKLSVILINNI